MEWHVNFADEALFGHYGGGLYAQDEMQVAEMPILASVREYLLRGCFENENLIPSTRNGDFCSPCLVRNALRCLTVKTDINEKEGRPYGLYGNNFMRASVDVISKALTIFEKPQLENIIAMEAPKGGRGEYDRNTILFLIKTVFTAFTAAVLESGKSKVVIHTGNFGCGAYGGNRVLSALAQIFAAHIANVHCLVYHTFSKMYSSAYESAMKLFDDFKKRNKNGLLSTEEFIEYVEEQHFIWGESDGN